MCIDCIAQLLDLSMVEGIFLVEDMYVVTPPVVACASKHLSSTS